MITKIILRNWQKHQKKVVDLERITVFVGESRAGKTCILRALRWITTNFPSGSGKFVTVGKKKLKVAIEVDGHKVTRTAGTAGNVYTLDKREPYKAFRSTVPPTIAELLKIDAVNFQPQINPYFWVTKTPGQIGKELNKLVGLEMIDEFMNHLSTEVRQANSEVTFSQKRLDESKAVKKDLAWTVQAKKDFQEIERLNSSIESTKAQIARISTQVATWAKYQDQKRDASDAKLEALEVLESGKLAASLAEQLDSLELFINSIETQERVLCESKRDLRSAEAKQKKLLGTRCPLCKTPM